MLALRTRSRVGLAVGVVLALLLLAPLLGPGFVLVRDMAFVPRMPLGGQLLGLDAVPRAVPSDLLVALASRVLPAAWLQHLILLAIVMGGAWGAARFAPTQTKTGTAAAAVCYGWSPYLHERLLLGQWALLLGWAVLPWAAAAAVRWRRGGSGWPTVVWLAVAAAGGASAVLLVALVVFVLAGHRLRTTAATVVLSLPWLVPSLLHPVVAGDPAGVAAFAAHTDTPFGVVVSVLLGGGVWAPAAVPAGRSVGAVIGLALLVVGAFGLPRVRRQFGAPLLVAAGIALVMALLGRLPGGADALRWGVQHLPATGLLRDGQKWVAPVVLLLAAAVGCGGERLVAAVVEPAARRVAAACLVLAPLAALPGAAWGESGDLRTSQFPAEWTSVAAQTSGEVLVLPWTLYRAFPWNSDRTILDPATKILSRPVVNDALPLEGSSVRGEDPVAAGLTAAVTAGGPLLVDLQHAGISQVLVEKTTRGFVPDVAARQTSGLQLLAQTPNLTLYGVPGAVARRSAATAWPAVAADLLAVLLAVTAGVGAARRPANGTAGR